jgi:hypothetical protein
MCESASASSEHWRGPRAAARSLLQRNQSRRGQHAHLPHSAAQRLAESRARSISSADPVSIDPTGAPSPFDKQNITVSNPRVSVFTSTPSAVAH